jgi:DNA-binding response OmpR family regulator
MRILIVEDSKRLRQTLATAMRRSGYRVDECGDGEEALSYKQKWNHGWTQIDTDNQRVMNFFSLTF